MTQWFVGNLVSGAILNYLPVSSGSWSTSLNEAGAISCTLPLDDPIVAALGIRNIATAGQKFLGVAENGVIMNAGPITGHSYSADDGTIDLQASGFWAMFAKRNVLPSVPAGLPDPTGYDTYLVGLDTGTVAKRLVQQSIGQPYQALPILFQPDVAGSSDITYAGADQKSISEALNDLVDNGIDIDFAPQFTSDGQSVQWLMRTGTDSAPQLTNANPTNPPTWDVSVPKPSVKGMKVDVDASNLTSRVWEMTGNTGLRSRVDTTNLTSQGYPFYETVGSSHSDVDEQPVLDRYARESARLGTKPTEMWSFQVEAGSQPLVGSYRVGDQCVVKVGNDPYISRGAYMRRITNLSGDQDGKWISVTTGQAYSITG